MKSRNLDMTDVFQFAAGPLASSLRLATGVLLIMMAALSCVNGFAMSSRNLFPESPLFTGLESAPCASDLRKSELARRVFDHTIIESKAAVNRFDILGSTEPVARLHQGDVRAFATAYRECILAISDVHRHGPKLVSFLVEVEVLFARLLSQTLAVGEFNQALTRIHGRLLSELDAQETVGTDATPTTSALSAERVRTGSLQPGTVETSASTIVGGVDGVVKSVGGAGKGLNSKADVLSHGEGIPAIGAVVNSREGAKSASLSSSMTTGLPILEQVLVDEVEQKPVGPPLINDTAGFRTGQVPGPQTNPVTSSKKLEKASGVPRSTAPSRGSERMKGSGPGFSKAKLSPGEQKHEQRSRVGSKVSKRLAPPSRAKSKDHERSRSIM